MAVDSRDPVRAAGAVLWRRAGDGIEVAVVHRPQYDDWSLPKGKLERDEHPLTAGLREVLEETGFRAEPVLRLPDVAYDLPDGSGKTVQFWAMRAIEPAAAPIADPAEVDEVAWLSPDRAAGRLSYPADADLVARVAALPPITTQTLLVRHARAGERKKWSGADALRPLDEVGREQAAGLADVLGSVRPDRLFAATPLRCKQTLEPLAERLGLPIVTDSVFAEPADFDEVPARAKNAAARLIALRDGGRAAICSQGKLIPPLLAQLTGAGDPEPYRTPKGGAWVLTWSGETLAGLTRL
jgi:8-oxo-dGTP diphosphatase